MFNRRGGGVVCECRCAHSIGALLLVSELSAARNNWIKEGGGERKSPPSYLVRRSCCTYGWPGGKKRGVLPPFSSLFLQSKI